MSSPDSKLKLFNGESRVIPGHNGPMFRYLPGGGNASMGCGSWGNGGVGPWASEAWAASSRRLRNGHAVVSLTHSI